MLFSLNSQSGHDQKNTNKSFFKRLPRQFLFPEYYELHAMRPSPYK